MYTVHTILSGNPGIPVRDRQGAVAKAPEDASNKGGQRRARQKIVIKEVEI